MNKLLIIFLILILFLFLLTTSVDALIWNRPTILESTLNVNSSNFANSSDFWDNLNTPFDILGSQISNDLNWITSTQANNTYAFNTSLSNIYIKSQVDNNFSLYYTKPQVDNNFTLYYTKTQSDTNLSLYALLGYNPFNQVLNTTSNVNFLSVNATNFTTSGFTINKNINGTGSITTTSTGFFGWLGSLTNYINAIFVTNVTTNRIISNSNVSIGIWFNQSASTEDGTDIIIGDISGL